MELPNQIGSQYIRHSLWAMVFMGLFLSQGSGQCSAGSQKVTSSIGDPYMTVRVRAAELVFIGSVVRLLRSDCVGGGLALSRQGIVFRVNSVLKGDPKLRGEFTAYYSLGGTSPLEVTIDGCHRLSPEIFEAGRAFIVACERNLKTDPKNRWAIVDGPWLADRDAEKAAMKAIAKGDIDFPQYVWLREEIDIERFIQGKDVPADPVLRAIRFFDELTGSQSSQSNKAIEDISMSGLQGDLNGWKAWYEKHHQCLVWDKNKSDEDVDKACMEKEDQ